MWHDTRQAFRVLAQHKLFAATAILVLALGMALNTATFSVVYALLFAPLPVHEPGALVSIYTSLRGQPDRPTIVFDDVRELLAQHAGEAFTEVTAHWAMPGTLHAEGRADLVHAEVITSNYFELLGVRPVLGLKRTSPAWS